MKKLLLAAFVFAACMGSLSAWPHHPGWHPGWHHPPPPPCYGYYGGYWGCSNGLANAAAITSIVANGLDIARTLSTPQTVVVQQPVVQQPIVVQQPVVQQPVVVQPAPVVYSGGTVIYR